MWRLKMMQRRWQAFRLLREAERAVASFPTRLVKTNHGLPFPVIVSLTSYAPRFATLAKTLKSLLDQEVQPDHVILWVAPDDYRKLPDDVMALERYGLTIQKCEDILSYKKLIPCLMKYPDSAIVTADDDLYYAPKWLGSILSAYDKSRPSIIATRAHLAKLGPEGRLMPYSTWVLDTHETADVSCRELLFPTGNGGIFYPPHLLPEEVLDSSKFLKLCPRGDDLWFFWMAERAKIPHVRISARFPMIPWQGSQDNGLYHDNLAGGGNDQQIAELEAALGLLGSPGGGHDGKDTGSG
jgi:hypothetical protein